MVKVMIDLDVFDFDYWNDNRVSVLRALIEREHVDDVRSLALIVGLNYASTYNIVMDFQKANLVIRRGRIIVLSDDWEKIFRLWRRQF